MHPRINTVSQFFIAQDDGAVPRLPVPPVVKNQIVRQGDNAEQRLGDRRAEQVGSLRNLIAGVQRALTGQDGYSSAAVQNVGGGFKLVRRGLRDRRHPRRGCAGARIPHRPFVGRQFCHLHVLGDGQVCDATIAQRHTTCAIGHQDGVFWSGHLDVIQRDLLH